MTTNRPSRRDFLRIAAAASFAGAARRGSGGEKTKMTMDLVCGNLGVKADLPTAVAHAHAYGFVSVAPDAGHIGRLSDGQLADLLGDLKAKGLIWGAAGLPVDFRGEDAAFRTGMAELPAFAARAEARRGDPGRDLDQSGPRSTDLRRQLPTTCGPAARGRRRAGRPWRAAGPGVRRAQDGLDVEAASVHPHAGGDPRPDRRDRPRRRRAWCSTAGTGTPRARPPTTCAG